MFSVNFQKVVQSELGKDQGEVKKVSGVVRGLTHVEHGPVGVGVTLSADFEEVHGGSLQGLRWSRGFFCFFFCFFNQITLFKRAKYTV